MLRDTGGRCGLSRCQSPHITDFLCCLRAPMPLSNLWLSFLFVLQCGNFAVLVDLHVLPPGGEEDASWFTADRVEVQKRGGFEGSGRE